MPTIGKTVQAVQNSAEKVKSKAKSAWKELKITLGISKRSKLKADELLGAKLNPLYEESAKKGGDNPLFGIETRATCPQNTRREPYSHVPRSTTIKREASYGCSASDSVISSGRNRGIATQQPTPALNFSEADLDSLLDGLSGSVSESV